MLHVPNLRSILEFVFFRIFPNFIFTNYELQYCLVYSEVNRGQLWSLIIRYGHLNGYIYFKLFTSNFKSHHRVERSWKRTHANFQENRSSLGTQFTFLNMGRFSIKFRSLIGNILKNEGYWSVFRTWNYQRIYASPIFLSFLKQN